MAELVKHVYTQQGNDISALLNDAAIRLTIPAQLLLACAMAESNLRETAWRDTGGDDRSAGLYQQTIRWAPIGDGTYSDANIAHVREVLTTNLYIATDIAARQLGAYWRQTQDWQETLAKYNGGSRAHWSELPNGNRLNYQRAWAESARYLSPEEAPVSEVQAEYIAGTVAGTFTQRPRGIILHSSRGGGQRATNDEYRATASYAGSGIELGWSATVGDSIYCAHMTAQQWGWNARAASSHYLAVELAQSDINQPITDGQVAAFCAWYRAVVVPTWGEYPVDAERFPSHAELEAWGETGAHDGKSDVYPAGDARLADLRERIRAALEGDPAPAPPAEEDELSAEERADLDYFRAQFGELKDHRLGIIEESVDAILLTMRVPKNVRTAAEQIKAVANTLRGELGAAQAAE